MKNAFRFLQVAVVVLFAISTNAIAGTTLKSSATEASLDVSMELTTRLVALPKVPSFTAKGKGILKYTLSGQSAVIKGESIPKLIYEALDPPPGLKGLTVIIEGVSGTTSTVDWKGYPQISLKPVELRVKAYEAKPSKITESSKPVVDVIMSDLSFSTDVINVEGIEDQGYIDADELEAQVVAKAMLPESDYPQYAEHLSGKPAVLELVIKMKNFFEKEKTKTSED